MRRRGSGARVTERPVPRGVGALGRAIGGTSGEGSREGTLGMSSSDIRSGSGTTGLASTGGGSSGINTDLGTEANPEEEGNTCRPVCLVTRDRRGGWTSGSTSDRGRRLGMVVGGVGLDLQLAWEIRNRARPSSSAASQREWNASLAMRPAAARRDGGRRDDSGMRGTWEPRSPKDRYEGKRERPETQVSSHPATRDKASSAPRQSASE